MINPFSPGGSSTRSPAPSVSISWNASASRYWWKAALAPAARSAPTRSRTPGRTPKEIISKLHSAIAAVLAMPVVQERMDTLGVELTVGGPDALAALVKSDFEKMGTSRREVGHGEKMIDGARSRWACDMQEGLPDRGAPPL
jgi:hypothetical protein